MRARESYTRTRMRRLHFCISLCLLCDLYNHCCLGGAGGTLITITGRGFPTLSAGLGDTVDVVVAGVPCAVQTSTYHSATCITGADPLTSLPAASIKGLFPGSRGIEYAFFNRCVTIIFPFFLGPSQIFWLSDRHDTIDCRSLVILIVVPLIIYNSSMYSMVLETTA